MIQLTSLDYEYLIKPSVIVDRFDDTLETSHQSKILSFLDGVGFQTEKIIVANKAGGADIFATSLIGQTWRIEVKKCTERTARKLQLVKLKNYYRNKAICMVAYGFEDFRLKYKYVNNLASAVS